VIDTYADCDFNNKFVIFVIFVFRVGYLRISIFWGYEKYFHTMQNQQDGQDAPPGPAGSRCRFDASGPSRHYDDERADRPLANDHIFDIIFTRIEEKLRNFKLLEDGDLAEPFSTRIVVEEAKKHFKWDDEKDAIEDEFFNAFLQYREVNYSVKKREILQEMAYAFGTDPEKMRKILQYEPPYHYRGPYPDIPKIIEEIYDCFKQELDERPYFEDLDQIFPVYERIMQNHSLTKDVMGLHEAIHFRLREFGEDDEKLGVIIGSMWDSTRRFFQT
jgi:hypothetical protein